MAVKMKRVPVPLVLRFSPARDQFDADFVRASTSYDQATDTIEVTKGHAELIEGNRAMSELVKVMNETLAPALRRINAAMVAATNALAKAAHVVSNKPAR